MSGDHSAALFARIGSYVAIMPGILARLWRFVIGPAVYRPAAHYMRGPGPKCREKNERTRPQS
ncbi:hypothetical protein [Tardiphaga sp. 813_E8_N1_3]|uniref:hypothetical protein n=1 Tax=Tardiphaga sp. 813_E8_N1_3 TaxID=3240760 RepID=UPI003F247F4B